MNDTPEISDLEFRLFRDFIHERFGIFLKEEKISFLKMKLNPRLSSLGLSSFKDYFNFIKYGALGEKELGRMISLLTNNETYFFRELPQLEVFRDSLLPQLRDRRFHQNDQKIRILSAGCSTGEEAYTLAMIVFETGSFFWGWDVKIAGMDISSTALDVARRGSYFTRSFRMTDRSYLRKFFSENGGDHFLIKESIRKMTDFVYGNITDKESFETIGEVDIIFCRNVLIYFSEEKMTAAIDNFHRTLKKGGFLLLGHSETLTGISEKFELMRFPGTIIYRKSEN